MSECVCVWGLAVCVGVVTVEQLGAVLQTETDVFEAWSHAERVKRVRFVATVGCVLQLRCWC